MIIITSESYPDIYLSAANYDFLMEAIVSRYARDNTSNNTRDTISDGTVRQPIQISCQCKVSNTGVYGYFGDPQTIFVQLMELYKNNEPVTVFFGASEVNPDQIGILFDWLAMTKCQPKFTYEQSNGYDLDIEFVEPILAQSLQSSYNGQMQGSSTSQQWTASKPINNGLSGTTEESASDVFG